MSDAQRGFDRTAKVALVKGGRRGLGRARVRALGRALDLVGAIPGARVGVS